MSGRNMFAGQNVWAIRPEVLGSLTQADFFADSLMQAGAQALPFAVTEGIAVIPVCGTLAKYGGYYSRSSYSSIQRDIAAALAAPEVRAILLDVDSPGGMADGCHETATCIAEADKQKPVYAYVADQACSAAYWLASQARYIGCTATGMAGSIGVLYVHWDLSGNDTQWGIKRTYLSAGEFKALGNDAEPLSDLARKTIEAQLQATYAIFLSTVSSGRNTNPEKTQAMAEGRVFVGQSAVDIGLADAVLTRTELFNFIRSEVNMNLSELKAQHPDLVQQAVAEALQQQASGQDTAVAEARKEERTRLAGLVGATMDAEAAAKLNAMLDAGVTVEQAQAMGVSITAQASVPVQAPEANQTDASKQAILTGLQQAAGTPAGRMVKTPAANAENPLITDAQKRGGQGK